MNIEDAIKLLNKFIKNFEEIQEMYKDDEVQAEIERQCYFEEVPYFEIKTLLAELDKQEKIINAMAKDISNQDIDEDICRQYAQENKCKDTLEDGSACMECIKQYYKKKVSEGN